MKDATAVYIVCLETRRVHNLDGPASWTRAARKVGDCFGWRDESSPTGFLSGFITEVGSTWVEVNQIAPAVINWNR